MRYATWRVSLWDDAERRWRSDGPVYTKLSDAEHWAGWLAMHGHASAAIRIGRVIVKVDAGRKRQ